jgi:hypothetical protein
MHKLGEPTALVKARQVDAPLVKEVLEPARKQYAGEVLEAERRGGGGMLSPTWRGAGLKVRTS